VRALIFSKNLKSCNDLYIGTKRKNLSEIAGLVWGFPGAPQARLFPSSSG